MRRPGGLPAAALVACALLLSPCARKDDPFRHDGHVTVAKGACGRCHGDDPANPRPAATADCASCHRQASDPGKAGIYGVAPRNAPRSPGRFGNVVFLHAPHAGAGIACAACHGEKGAPVFPTREECSRCHEKAGA